MEAFLLYITGAFLKHLALFSGASLIAQLVKISLQCRRPQFDSWVRNIRWRRDRLPTPVFLGFSCGSAGKESACNVGDLGSVPDLGRSPGEGNGYPLQYSGILGWRIPWTIQSMGVAKSWTWLNDFHCLLTYNIFLPRKSINFFGNEWGSSRNVRNHNRANIIWEIFFIGVIKTWSAYHSLTSCWIVTWYTSQTRWVIFPQNIHPRPYVSNHIINAPQTDTYFQFLWLPWTSTWPRSTIPLARGKPSRICWSSFVKMTLLKWKYTFLFSFWVMCLIESSELLDIHTAIFFFFLLTKFRFNCVIYGFQ